MPTTRRQLRRPLIALVAMFAASLAASEASACTAMEPGKGACLTVCGCCSPEPRGASATRADVADRAAIPMAPMACETSPVTEGSCRSQEPADPTPKPARSTAERHTEPVPGSDFVLPGDDHAARIGLALKVPATQSPPKT